MLFTYLLLPYVTLGHTCGSTPIKGVDWKFCDTGRLRLVLPHNVFRSNELLWPSYINLKTSKEKNSQDSVNYVFNIYSGNVISVGLVLPGCMSVDTEIVTSALSSRSVGVSKILESRR
jgi:hypothetical protein